MCIYNKHDIKEKNYRKTWSEKMKDSYFRIDINLKTTRVYLILRQINVKDSRIFFMILFILRNA